MTKTTQLAPGVQLLYLPKTQYQTVNITVTFAQKAQTRMASKRALLSYLMAVSSKEFPNQQAVSQELIDYFGANFQTKVSTIGDLDLLTASLQIIQPGQLPESDDLLAEGLSFLQSMIFNFDWESANSQAVIKQEKQNLTQAILGRQDDKVVLALDEARQLTFADSAIQESILGTKEEVQALSLAELQAAHAALLANDQVLISVVGDVAEEDLVTALTAWSWPTNPNRNEFRAKVPQLADFSKKVQTKPDLQQAVLVQNYQLGQGAASEQGYFTALVFNAVFGEGPASLLFTEIREKNSLAYSISSRLQPDLALITVVAGYDAEQQDRLRTLLAEQLATVKAGHLAEEQLVAAKAAIINDYLVRQDSPIFQSLSLAARTLRGINRDETAFMKGVEAVTLEEIQDFAATLTITTDFVLEPGR